MSFAEKLKEKRAQSGLTQADLAWKAGVTARTIQNYELGTRRPSNMVVVQRIADALGTTTEYLLGSAGTLIVEAHERGGAKAARDIDALVSEVTGMFAGGTLSDDAHGRGHARAQRGVLDSQGEEQEVRPQKGRGQGMNARQLSEVGERLVRRCGTRDPFEMARQLGVEVLFCPDFGSMKGMYRVIHAPLHFPQRRPHAADAAHSLRARAGPRPAPPESRQGRRAAEFMLYDMSTRPEYEANIVAAEILLDTDEVLDYVYNFGYTSEQIAKAMSTDINLVALKVAHLAESNRGLRPIEHRADFLKGDRRATEAEFGRRGAVAANMGLHESD